MKKKDIAPAVEKNEIVVYQPEGGEFHIEVRVENESVWLTQAQMAELFHATKQNISLHIARIFKEGELDPKVVVKEYLTTTQHGAITGKTQVHAVKNYNLDVIISVGYRIKSIQGTRFRQYSPLRPKSENRAIVQRRPEGHVEFRRPEHFQAFFDSERATLGGRCADTIRGVKVMS